MCRTGLRSAGTSYYDATMAFSTTVESGSNQTKETVTGHIETIAITHRY